MGSFIWFIVEVSRTRASSALVSATESNKSTVKAWFIVTYWINFSLVSVSEAAIVRVISCSLLMLMSVLLDLNEAFDSVQRIIVVHLTKIVLDYLWGDSRFSPWTTCSPFI